jgi:hypothetical protein
LDDAFHPLGPRLGVFVLFFLGAGIGPATLALLHPFARELSARPE